MSSRAPRSVLFVAGAGNDGDRQRRGAVLPLQHRPRRTSSASPRRTTTTSWRRSRTTATSAVDLAAPGDEHRQPRPSRWIGPPLFDGGLRERHRGDVDDVGTHVGAYERTAAAPAAFSLTDSPAGNYADDRPRASRGTRTASSLAGRKGCSGTMKVRLDTQTAIFPAPSQASRDDFVVSGSPTSNGAGIRRGRPAQRLDPRRSRRTRST